MLLNNKFPGQPSQAKRVWVQRFGVSRFRGSRFKGSGFKARIWG